MISIGLDLGSSFIKGVLFDNSSGEKLAETQYPEVELAMTALQPGWAEQSPNDWWEGTKIIIHNLLKNNANLKSKIKAIGISYQMHGLVILDKNLTPLRDAIIWCDSRSVDIGRKAFNSLGEDFSLNHLLNSPGNFTASKLRWVLLNEPDIAEKIYKIMLPGDFLAMKLTGEISTTTTGLSEGIFFDFKRNKIAHELLNLYQINPEWIPHNHSSFYNSGKLKVDIANELGLDPSVAVSYRAGDQPNNALSLNVLNPGEIAATAGTSGVIYGVSDVLKPDPKSRVNTFAHVNYTEEKNNLGILLCINGTGILNRWIKQSFEWESYNQMNGAIKSIKSGAEGLLVYPFGNGSERVLQDKSPGCSIHNLDFNRHNKIHIARAAQEGIAFSLNYGLDIMRSIGVVPITIRAGKSNMFLSDVFSQTISDISGTPIELYDTNGAVGAAIGSAIGLGYYKESEAFEELALLKTLEPTKNNQIVEAYNNWISGSEDLHGSGK